MDLTAVPGIIGGLSGLLGGNKGAQQAGKYRGQQLGYLGGVGANASRFGDLADLNLGDYNQRRGDRNAAYGDLTAYLRRNPDTDQQYAYDMSRSTRAGQSAYDAARARVASSLQARGLGEGPSSIGTGAETGIDLAQAGDVNQAAGQASQIAAARRAQNLHDLYGVTDQAAGESLGAGQAELGQQDSLDQWLSGQYGGLADQAQAAGDAQGSDFLSGLTGLAQNFTTLGGLGGLLGGGEKKKNAKLTGDTYLKPNNTPMSNEIQVGVGY